MQKGAGSRSCWAPASQDSFLVCICTLTVSQRSRKVLPCFETRCVSLALTSWLAGQSPRDLPVSASPALGLLHPPHLALLVHDSMVSTVLADLLHPANRTVIVITDTYTCLSVCMCTTCFIGSTLGGQRGHCIPWNCSDAGN